MLAAAWAWSALIAACSPTLNWRQVSVPGAPLAAHFPCKPDQFSRRLPLAGHTLSVGLNSCEAGAQTFAITAVDMQQASRAGAGQAALRQAVEQNFAGQVQGLAPRPLPGGVPVPAAEYLSARMPLAGGGQLQAHVLLFSHGAWVFQVTVVGERPQSEAVDFFFDNLRPLPL